LIILSNNIEFEFKSVNKGLLDLKVDINKFVSDVLLLLLLVKQGSVTRGLPAFEACGC